MFWQFYKKSGAKEKYEFLDEFPAKAEAVELDINELKNQLKSLQTQMQSNIDNAKSLAYGICAENKAKGKGANNDAARTAETQRILSEDEDYQKLVAAVSSVEQDIAARSIELTRLQRQYSAAKHGLRHVNTILEYMGKIEVLKAAKPE